MKITQGLMAGKVHVSLEMFPPKSFESIVQVQGIAAEMACLKPSFISVTYGAGGISAPSYTMEVAKSVQAAGCEPLFHLTCVNAVKEDIDDVLQSLAQAGIDNVLALRGDIPAGETFPGERQYAHAAQLIAQIKQTGAFCVGAACYPEGHPEAPSRDTDLDFLRAKVDAGADFLTTQLFFDNNILYNFLYRAMRKGIRVPVCAGIMPVVNAGQIKRICALSAATLPPRFAAIIDRFGGDKRSMAQAGIAFATEQIIDLVANGISNIHIYTMNRPEIAGAIFSNLSHIIGNEKEVAYDS